MEKRLEGQENMALGFIDLEKAYDTFPREMATQADGCPKGGHDDCRRHI